MKKNILTIILIITIIVGSISITISLKYLNDNDNKVYIPEITPYQEDEKNFGLSGYKEIEYNEILFPIYDEVISTNIFYSEESYLKIELDETYVEIGQIIEPGSVVGKNDSLDVACSTRGMVVESLNNSIVIKDFTKVFASFYKNVYDSFNYKVSDEFYILKNGRIVADALISKIDYINIVNDFVEVKLSLDNFLVDLYDNTSVDIVSKEFESENALSLKAEDLGFDNHVYKDLNRIIDCIYVENKTYYNLELELSLLSFGNVKINSITYDGEPFHLNGGKLYVKSND